MGLEYVGHWIGSWISRGSKLKRTCCSKNTPIIPRHGLKVCLDQAGGVTPSANKFSDLAFLSVSFL